MILKKDMLTKALAKGRFEAESILKRLSAAGGMPPPQYDHEASGFSSRKSHYIKVRFIVPQFLRNDYFDFGGLPNSIFGSGRCLTKRDAKSLASLEVIHQLQADSGMSLNELKKHIEEREAKGKLRREEIEATSLQEEMSGVSWSSIPKDPSFVGQDRSERIRFFPQVVNDSKAFAAAKGLTLRCQDRLPKITHHANPTYDFGEEQRFANIRPHCGPKSKAIVGSPRGEESKLIRTEEEAEIKALHKAYQKYGKKIRRGEEEDAAPTSFGMGKLFARLPDHQVDDLRKLLDQVDSSDDVRNGQDGNRNNCIMQKMHAQQKRSNNQGSEMMEDENLLNSRFQSLRSHQQQLQLPVDSVEDSIHNNNAAVTIVQGGTGSGKTTRYPLMLSLFSPTGPRTRVLVAQPRRLACQTAAQRVAYEQNVKLGSDNCPIGYSIRFESVPSNNAQQRTVDFQTPGVILRRAMEDPTLSDVTHLVLDEVHERNADIDLLVALAKEAQRQRKDSDNPLRIILMSATLDALFWRKYFQSTDSDDVDVAVVDVPSKRRFPIDIVHVGEDNFPNDGLKSINILEKVNHVEESYDDLLCSAAADLAVKLIASEEVLNGGSILVFLPGIDQIREVDRMIDERTRQKGMKRPSMRYLHSSLSSNEQQKVFIPGAAKIILSTNIAETSVTIPDVKFVIDTGREKQFSMLDDSANEDWMSVVGSQLKLSNISQASAQQRSGRAGRISAGTCYRLYSRDTHDNEFAAYTKPEMLRVDLSQMILHSLSMYQPESGKPLDLLLQTPDPPALSRMKQTIRSLKFQGLVDGGMDDDNVILTPLGCAVSSLPVSPRIGRMLYMGLVLRAADPALQIAALLSVPKVFQRDSMVDGQHTSDIVRILETYQEYLERNRSRNTKVDKEFEQARRVENQLKRALMDVMKKQGRNDIEWSKWNENTHRLAAVAALVCTATPHVAHMVGDRNDFATRDVAGGAKIHPGSCNFRSGMRTHWYLYNELRRTTAPYLHVTTAVSPLEVALFAEATSLDNAKAFNKYRSKKDNWLFLADQWVPVVTPGKGDFLGKLRKLVSHDLVQMAAQDPNQIISNPLYTQVILFVLSAIGQQRVNNK